MQNVVLWLFAFHFVCKVVMCVVLVYKGVSGSVQGRTRAVHGNWDTADCGCCLIVCSVVGGGGTPGVALL